LLRNFDAHHSPLSLAQIVTQAVADDERVSVPQAPNVWFRPLMLNTLNGQWRNLLRVRRAGILSRHRHPAPVHGYVIKRSWRYLEHDWIARPGDYVFELPGETHTLIVDADVEEMITFFNISGCMYYVDESGNHTGFEDVFTKIDMCRRYYTMSASEPSMWISLSGEAFSFHQNRSGGALNSTPYARFVHRAFDLLKPASSKPPPINPHVEGSGTSLAATGVTPSDSRKRNSKFVSRPPPDMPSYP
jgi:2,4'-dihydroxyacetophenone dioxygenase